MFTHWLADRTRLFDASGIRKVFDLGAKLKNPINLSIGQPDFEPPDEVRRAAIEAIQSGKNGYALTQGIPQLREKLHARIKQEYAHADRELFVTSGTSGGLMLALMVLINPGDEVIIFDPYFVMYDALVKVVGGKVVPIDTYPDFKIDLDRMANAITPRTKIILFNSPANPTGAVADEETVRGLAELAAQRNVVLLSDEIYRAFCYDGPFISPTKFNEQTLVIDGFSKTYGIPGWRLGFAHGPSAVIHEMIKLQQFSFVCAPHPFQWAGAAALDVDMGRQIESYRRKRDMIVAGLADDYELVAPGGAFYAFPKLPWGTGMEFVGRAIEEYQLLVIPGSVFSRRDTHFRISYAAPDKVIQRGIEALKKLARP
ncbi:MAG: pyridoxal phosphate-dependent aminotransferase [Thermoguttaceae bacterium]|jgi:aspartate aminotransferase/aminotransferase